MNEKNKVCKVGLHISLMVLVIQAVVFLILFLLINGSVSGSAKDNAVNSMKNAALDRSEIIMNYVRSAEDSLTAYLKADQIYDMLKDQSDPEKSARISQTLKVSTQAVGIHLFLHIRTPVLSE